MKLAEALIMRSDMQKSMELLKKRISNNILIQDGDLPSEDPKLLIKKYMNMQNELTKLIKSINKTNNNTEFDNKMMLSEALAERDSILNKRNMLADLVEKGSQKQDRYSRSEIKYVSTVDVKKLQKEADELSKNFRELDTKIQAMNWIIDLI